MEVMKHAITGHLEFQNGVTGPLHWLRFINGTLPLEKAKEEAVRMVIATAATPQYRDSTVKRCWAD